MARSHRSSLSFAAGSFAIAVLLLAGFSRTASATAPLVDDFSENTQASFWYLIAGDPAETLVDTGGLLQFTATSAATGFGCNYLLKEQEIDATQDFEVQATWHLAAMTGIQNNQEAYIGIQIMGVSNGNLSGNSAELRNRWQNNGSGAFQRFGVKISQNNNQIDNDNWTPGSNVTDGTYYISYTASTDTLYVSLNGYHHTATSNGDWVYPGVVKGQWGAARVVAMLETESQGVAVTSGQAYYSNFQVAQWNMVTPLTVTAPVTSLVNGAAGTVAINFVGPAPDNNGLAAGNHATPFAAAVKLDQGFPIFLTAPATDGAGNNFTCWEVNGVPSVTDEQAQLWLNPSGSNTVTAVYGGAPALFCDSLSGSAIGAWWYVVEQNSAQVYLQEQTQGLELISANSASTGQMAYCMLKQRRLDLDNSSGFKLQADWNFAVNSGTSGMGILLLGQQSEDENVSITVNYDPTNGATFQVAGASTSNGWSFSDMLARTAASGTLYIYYDNNNNGGTLYLSKNGYGPFVNNPANGDWVFGNDNNFYGFNSSYLAVGIGGSASGVAISSGTAYLDNFKIIKGGFDTPTTGQVSVMTDLGSTGVSMYFSPADDSGAGNGTTPFVRTVENDIPIFITAPGAASGDNFVNWGQNWNAFVSDQPNISVMSNSSPNYEAIYQTAASTVTLTVQSTPATGVVITSSTGHNGTTNYTVPGVTTGTTINLVAPATAGANSFLYWQGNGLEFSANTSITFPADGNFTLVAVYGSATPGSLTVNLSPAAAVTAGATWSLDGGNTWHASGANVTNLSSGSLAVCYSGLPGWTSPPGQFATITAGNTTTVTAPAYTENTYTLTVQSTPPTSVAITSSTSDGGTTNYAVSSVPYGTNVALTAPATDPTGYTFSQWKVNGAGQAFAQKTVTFAMTADTTAVALYDTVNTHTLDVQSTPPSGIAIGSSGSFAGTTEYFVSNIGTATSINLQAPATDPPGYTFSEWTLNGTALTAGQKSVTFTISAGTTVLAVYTTASYTLTVQSTPLPGQSIGSYSGFQGTTNYTVTGIAYGTAVDIEAPSNDTGGNNFYQWVLNGVGQGGGTFVSFTVNGNTTAVAQFVPPSVNLSVQSTPMTGIVISSSTGQGGMTDYTDNGLSGGSSVNLQAPASDPFGYVFSQWTVNGTAQTAGLKSITFVLSSATMTAVAQYATNYVLTVQSTSLTGVGIASSAGDGGTTNYSVPGITSAQSIDLAAPATDPTGYTFREWTVNGAAQTAAQKEITFPAPATFATWGGEGSGNGQFNFPNGIAVAGNGNVYLADTDNNLIQEFTSAGVFITQWGGLGSGNGQLDNPFGVAVAGNGNVYVADTFNNLIQEFTSAGVFVTQWGGYGSGNGEFEYPLGIAVDAVGNVYVADTDNNRIQKFTAAGAYLTQWGSYGSGNVQFEGPEGIAVASGNVYVIDTGNNRVEEFTNAGGYVGQWGGGGGNGQFSGPMGIALDGNGNVYVADTDNNLIQEFTSAGVFVTQWGSSGSGNGQFVFPAGVAADVAGNVYVADTYNCRIQAFRQNILAVAQYIANTTLTVQSTPVTGVLVTSTSGHGGTTNYAVTGVTAGTSVNLSAPATDPIGYTFQQWTVNGTAQTAGLKTITFSMTPAAVAVAHYTIVTYTLSVESAPPSGLAVTSSTGDAGTTNYTAPVTYNANVNLVAPATDPHGYAFQYWTVNGTSQPGGQKSISFTMTAPTLAVAQYSSTYNMLTVQSTPPTGIGIASTTGDGGTTDYTVSSISYGATVNIEAPATDPYAYTFSGWTLNGVAQTPGLKTITFTVTADATAVAQYTLDPSTLAVQSAPAGLSIGSNTGDAGATNYTVPNVAAGVNVNLQAPATDPTGYVFAQWAVNGVSQGAGVKNVTFAAPPGFLQWGSSGSGTGEFQVPFGIAVDSAGNVYVDDYYNQRIQKFTPNGTYYTAWGSLGTGNGQFNYPTLIAVDASNNVYVVDWSNNRIQKFTSSGVFVTKWGSFGTDDGHFDFPNGIAVDTAGNVYVADTNNCRIQKFTSTGVYLAQWGSYGGGNGEFSNPQGVAVDGGGYVYVADTFNDLVQKFTSTGVFVTQWGGSGSGNGTFNYPGAIAADSAGDVFVADTDNDLIQMFTTGGVFVAQWGGAGAGPAQFSSPYGVAVDSPGNVIYVADSGNDRVQVLSRNILAAAQYTGAPVTLTVQSTPVPGLGIGSSTGDAGTTNYSVPGISTGTSINLVAPATDPTGFTFSQWTLNGAAQTAALKSITFTMAGATTAIAQYTLNTYTLTVQSNPPAGLSIISSTGDAGTTNYTVSSVGYGASVNLLAPAADPGGLFAFSQWTWTLNGVAQTAGAELITFAMTGDTTVVAHYTPNTGTLSVQSTDILGDPLPGIPVTGTYPGTTNYAVGGIAFDTSVSLTAPAADPSAYYSFTQWTLNGSAATTGRTLAFTTTAGTLVVAQYTLNTYTLNVQSTPPTALGIASSTGFAGTTNYTIPGVGAGTSVNLQAPAADPLGYYTFSLWTLNGVAQTAGVQAITFTMTAATTAAAQYTLNTYTLNVQSTPPTGLGIASTTGFAGTTSYTYGAVGAGTSVNLQAPVADPLGYYTFSVWTLNGTAQTAGQRSITFTMTAAATAIAQYTLNTYALNVQSTSLTGIAIASSAGFGGTTNYTISAVGAGTSVDLEAPVTDPTGYTFSQWTLNGAAQTAGQKSIAFTVTAATTAIAHYTLNTYTLNVQSTPLTGIAIASSTGFGGTTNYAASVAYNTSVTLTAPMFDVSGNYSFSVWTLNGTAQTAGQRTVTFAMPPGMTAVAQYLPNYTLTVQSTPPAGLGIGSSTGDAGTTNYTAANIPQGTSVNLQAPATDPAGYTFSQWTLNGTAQTALQKSITFAISAATTAAAQYTLNTYNLTVLSTPPAGVSIASSTGFAGTTNYIVSSVAYGASVNLQAPLADPSGYYTFSNWTLNGVAQTAGLAAMTFTMTATTTAEAYYTLNTYTLNVQSTPPTALGIASSTGFAGTTNYTVPGIAAGTSVNLQAPLADSLGYYTFSEWTLNGVAQTPGAQAITFTMTAATTAAAHYTLNTYALNVQSTPPDPLSIGSTTGFAGTTSYTYDAVGAGTSVNLQAPVEDPLGYYTFSGWTLNGAAQTAGQRSITFTMTAATTAIAQYTLNTYALNVQSTPPTGLGIGSIAGYGGTTNYAISAVGAGTSVDLEAPDADPTGYTFSVWTVNGAVQTADGKTVNFTVTAATTAIAQYTANIYTLDVQSTPTGIAIASSTGFGGTTEYTLPVAYNTSVTLTAPMFDVSGTYSFSAWTLNGAAQTAGQRAVTFAMPVGMTAVAQYVSSHTLTVQSIPPSGIAIGSSGGYGGTTNYTVPSVLNGTSVNLQAPAADPGGYFFLQWAVNGVAQTAGVKSITFSMTAATTAVAQYAPVITVRSQNPASGVTITISPADLSGASNGVTPLTRTYSSGTSITLTAPLAASGNNFQKWQMNGSDYTTNAAISVTAGPDTYTAVYLTPTAAYTLAVQSTPPTGLVIASSTGHNGTTNYTKSGVGNGTVVNLAAPAVDPAGYVFLEWTVNGAAQSPGQKSITLTMAAATTAVAQYGVNGGYTLSVQSAPPSQVVITSSTGQGGTTNYTVPGIRQGTNVSLQAPATDPSGYTFTQWTVNGAAQSPGQKGIAFMVNAAVTAVAQYSSNTSYALSVQSAPPTGLVIASSTGQGQTTNYVIAKVAQGTVVNLQAPAAEPAGYTFSQWTVNGAAQSPGQKSVTFAMASATTAVARYTANAVYALTVQSTPPTGVAIGSSTGQGGTTNYSKATVPGGSIVELAAPGTDPANYTFWQWVVNGAAQPAGQKSVTFAMVSGVTAVARYTLNAGYTLTVQSTPPGGVSIGSSTGQSGTTSYSVTQIAYGTGVNLVAPANDPANYSFSEWTLNGAAQAAGQKGITFTMDGAVTAVAHYSLNSTYALAVQSTPPGGVSIGSSTGNNGTTNYTNTLAYGTMVNLSAPANDPAGYTFAGWTVNGTAQAAGQKSVTFAMASAVTAVARYTANATWALAVQSTPAAGVAIGSSTGQGGTTNYTKSGLAAGSSVNLSAPANDPAGYTFSQWVVNGSAQAPGQKAVTFAMTAAVTAVARYTANTAYALTVQSTPASGIAIGSSSGEAGTTNYVKSSVSGGTSVELTAPATATVGGVAYAFSQWALNGAAQAAGVNAVTFTMGSAVTAVAQYTKSGNRLTVESTPPTGLVIGSSTGQKGTTNYYINGSSVAAGSSVNLAAPAGDPAGYTFAQWVVNGTAQTAGQKAITFTMGAGNTVAAAEYSLSGYALTVKSTPPAAVVIGSGTGQNGTTSYSVPNLAYGTVVNLQAPANDPGGYAFEGWTLNGAAQTAGQKAVTFTMGAAVTAVAQYTANAGYTLTVQSNPPAGVVIGSSTGHNGTTNYSVPDIAYGTVVNLQAPAADPAGYAFAQWTVNGSAQTAGQKAVTFTMSAAATAAAQYTLNSGYLLTVQSTPPAAVVIGSGTGQNGTTNYTAPGIGYGTLVNLIAPAADPAGYGFVQWTVNGAAQTAGQKSVTFTMAAAVTAVAHYTVNTGYALSVQSTPPSGVVIGSSTGQGGTTSYTKSGLANGTVIVLTAPASDPAGYTFSAWTVNGAVQTAGQKSVAFALTAAVTAVAQYTANAGYALVVQSTPATGVLIGSSSGHNGTTNYTIPGIGYGTVVNLAAPASDPAGYTFSQWTLNGSAQTAGQKAIGFTMDAAVTAVAQYTANAAYTLVVQSTPAKAVVIGSSTGHNGTTNYSVPNIAFGTSVNLAAPAADPAGYTFSQWALNGAAQGAGQKTISFAMYAAVTAVAQYTANAAYTLVVQSTPATAQVIGSSTGHNGTTNYSVPGIAYGTVVNLAAPAADPAGYTFSGWTLNATAQTAGQKAISFTLTAAVTAVAHYTANIVYTLNVQSTPATAVVIGSSTGHNGTTNYAAPNIAYGTVVNLAAPATDPAGFTFAYWTLNGAAQPAGQKAITFGMTAATTAVAHYTVHAGLPGPAG